MKKILLFLAVIFSLYVNGQQTTDNRQSLTSDIGIIPSPQDVSYLTTDYFALDESCVLLDNENEEISRIINIFKNDIQEITGLDLEISKKKKKKYVSFELIRPSSFLNYDSLTKIQALRINQGYNIIIKDKFIHVSASTPQGLFYGTQSLKQLIRHQLLTENNLNIPCYNIFDYPSLEYRGWMDDISRGPIPTKEFIKEEIRRLAEYKFNFFNLYTEHLFKLEDYPDIAPTDGLTAEEIKELTDFAKDYYIEFIGNQQCFAHAEKTLDNPFYDDIKDTRFNFNPGVDETYEFLEVLLGETAQAYESK